jgi:pimeloyl-ACP methyl ester carboxylesterase
VRDSVDIVARLDPGALARFERFERAGHGVWIDHPVRAFTVLEDFTGFS